MAQNAQVDGDTWRCDISEVALTALALLCKDTKEIGNFLLILQ